MHVIKRFFVDPDEHRLLAGWRVVVHFVLFVVLLALCSVVFAPLTRFVPRFLFGEGIAAIAVTVSVFIARRWLDKRSFRSLGLAWNRQAVSDLAVGFLITGVMMGMVFLLEWAVGILRLETVAWRVDDAGKILSGTLGMFFLFLLVAWAEELLSRGYQLQNLAEGLSPARGVVISSLIFAALHTGNPGFTGLAFVGLFLSGVFMAWAWVLIGSLWLPIGIHLGWNFFEGTVFGFPVSGLGIYRLLRPAVHGSDWFTGGAFGPEAGAVLLPALLLGFWLVEWYARVRGNHVTTEAAELTS